MVWNKKYEKIGGRGGMAMTKYSERSGIINIE